MAEGMISALSLVSLSSPLLQANSPITKQQNTISKVNNISSKQSGSKILIIGHSEMVADINPKSR